MSSEAQSTGWTPCTPENECSDPGARECRCRRLQEPTDRYGYPPPVVVSGPITDVVIKDCVVVPSWHQLLAEVNALRELLGMAPR